MNKKHEMSLEEKKNHLKFDSIAYKRNGRLGVLWLLLLLHAVAV